MEFLAKEIDDENGSRSRDPYPPKVQDDEEFRNRLIRNPKAVILAETGIELSDDKMIFVEEEIRKGALQAAGSDRALTDEELRQISGGRTNVVGEWLDSISL